MKKTILFIASAILLCGCGTQAAEPSSKVDSKEIQNKPRYSFGISDKSIIEEKDGDYILVVSYIFENNSGKSQSFILACSDSAYMNGIECEHTNETYELTTSQYIQSADRIDKILTGKTAKVNVGYKLKDFNPDINKEITIQITDRVDASDVFSETKIDTKDIRITAEKD